MNELAPNWWRYWAKAGHGPVDDCHLLAFHSADVAACAWALLRGRPDVVKRFDHALGLAPGNSTPVVVWLAGLHDIGKFGDGFQSLRPDTRAHLWGGPRTPARYSERHDATGRRDLTKIIVDHTAAGSLNGRAWGRSVDRSWGVCTTGHHGKPVHRAKEDPLETALQDAKDFAAHFAEIVATQVGVLPALTERLQDAALSRSSWFLAGLVNLADWLGSQEHVFRWSSTPRPLGEYFAGASMQAIDAVKEAGLNAKKCRSPAGFATLFPKYTSPTATQEAADRLSLPPGPCLICIEDVTGSGKTEAALSLAHRLIARGSAHGLYFALPTTATANQMYDRLAGAYHLLFEEGCHPSLMLSHGASDLSDTFVASVEGTSAFDTYDGEADCTAGAECTAWLADSRKKTFLADAAVGTIDQALLAVLPSKHQSLRLWGLSKSVLIVDEVHAYDAYTGMLLKRLVEFQAALGGSTVLLSATLPQHLRKELADAYRRGIAAEPAALVATDYPLVTALGADEQSEVHPPLEFPTASVTPERRVAVARIETEQEAIAVLSQASDSRQCGAWIRNTVSDAVEAYRLLSAQFGTANVMLFHARYAHADRQAIEKKVVDLFGKGGDATRRQGKLLVATQVVEQSLDLDFDVLVTDLAPIELVFQRAGRLHRHSRAADGKLADVEGRPAPVLTVLSPEPVSAPSEHWYGSVFPRAQYVYPDHGRLWLGARWLFRVGEVVVPRDSRESMSAVYGASDDAIPAGLVEKTEEAEIERVAGRSFARTELLSVEQGYGATESLGKWLTDTKSVTRLGDVTVRLRLAKTVDGKVVPWADPPHAWRHSEVSVLARRVAEVVHPDPAAAEAAKATMTDGGKYSVLVVLDEAEDGFSATVLDHNNKVDRIHYCPLEGLEFVAVNDAHKPRENP